jgi:hypothetical protein
MTLFMIGTACVWFAVGFGFCRLWDKPTHDERLHKELLKERKRQWGS